MSDLESLLASQAFQRGDFAAAAAHGERMIAADQNDAQAHAALGMALRELVKIEGAEIALADIVAAQPHAYTSELHRAWLQERRGDARAAVLGYLRAIKSAQLHGFWLAETNTPPWLMDLVRHAMKVAHAGRRQLLHEVLAPLLARYGRDDLRRVGQCLAMYLGEVPTTYADPRQKPSFLYFPGLPVAPVFARDCLPFADWYEERAPAIREEMLAVLADASAIQPFHYSLSAEQRESLTRGASWDAYFFDRDGVRFGERHAACPATSATLAELPLDHIRDHGPEVCFSIMRPGAHILPHRGVTNIRSVLHLGLVIPEDCALNLTGVGEVRWQEDRCFAFDDTYEHEAWNRSGRTRVILLADIWNPYLDEAERAAVTDLIVAIGDLNQATAAASLA